MNTFKQKLIAGLLALAALLGGGYTMLGGGPSDVSTCFDDTAGAATTSAQFLAGDGATTTLIALCPINRAEAVSLTFIVNSTSTPTVRFLRSFSHDGGTWFYESNQTLSSETVTTISGSTTPLTYTHSQTGTTTRTVPLSDVAARYMRLEAGITGADGVYLWVGLNKREGNN